ncbi:hypothetical protein [Chryseobacterium sediminis]|uniref:hypothetical protein n=1 Tax=Chryseobacterium sediminis TaxID=1679494 RepID=UPI002863DDD5|nr:hypothetical protein [Chryseobacterium sediminis]MDR6463285.1 hypothetical protein [Chryseobacterium sediminis]
MNENPIKTEDDGEYVKFNISPNYGTKRFFITTKTELLEEGWKMYLIHGMNLRGLPQDFDPTPDIVKKDLGLCQDLNNARFALFSHVSRFSNGAKKGSLPPKIKYTLKFEVEDEAFENEFVAESTFQNPFIFITLIKFITS